MTFPLHRRNRKPFLRVVGVVLAVVSATFFSALHGGEMVQNRVAFPAGYRDWVHVKSGVIGPTFPMYETEGGIHHIYANRKALAGFSTGTFEDGSILVYDLLSLSEKSGIGTEGARRRIDVMVKNGKRYAATGGWGFARFMGDDHDHDVLTPEVTKVCYQCHQKRSKYGLVFSDLRP